MRQSRNNNTGAGGKWYDKFTKKPVEKKPVKKSFENSKDGKTNFKHSDIEAQKGRYSAGGKSFSGAKTGCMSSGSTEKMTPVLEHTSMFPAGNIPPESQKIISDFTSIIQSVQPLNSKQLAKVPLAIRDLSHELTDERGERRRSYMNETVRLSSYIRYYMWWNLVRLTRLFAGFKADYFNLKDEDICLDVGSGPLTVVIALWLARPELRSKHLTWYSLDISQGAMALGEEIFLSIAAKTLAGTDTAPWKIVRVKGEMGTFIKQKASFITCANMFNELLQHTDMPPDYSAKKYSDALLSYASEKASVLVIEPGVPRSARLISLMRDAFLRRDYMPLAPCPHCLECPMDGKKGGKWCNFAFTTDDAPAKLLKLSDDAGIPKERAVLSFVFVSNAAGKKSAPEETLHLRVASDPIRLPFYQSGFYACSELGLTLAVNKTGKKIFSGDTLTVKMPEHPELLTKDEKSGAVEISI